MMETLRLCGLVLGERSTVTHESVWILGIFYGGQNVEDIISDEY